MINLITENSGSILAELLLLSFHYKGIFHEVYVYSHRLRTLLLENTVTMIQ